MKALLEVTKDALELPSEHRFALARILLDVSEASETPDSSIEEAWEVEIAKRIASIKNGTAQYRSAEVVFAELDRRFPG
jgi:hypothetical protein